MTRSVLLAILSFLFITSCQQYEVSTDFFERIPENNMAKLLKDKPGLKKQSNVAGIGYGKGSRSLFMSAQVVRQSQRETDTDSNFLFQNKN